MAAGLSLNDLCGRTLAAPGAGGLEAASGVVLTIRSRLGSDLEGTAPILLWLLEGQVLSEAELASLVQLCRREPRLKLVVEMGGARALRWQPLEQLLSATV